MRELRQQIENFSDRLFLHVEERRRGHYASSFHIAALDREEMPISNERLALFTSHGEIKNIKLR